jgi:hypothetical protein
MGSHLRTDLNQLFPKSCQRPVLHRSRPCQPPQEISQVVRQGKQLQANGIFFKAVAGQARPVQDVLALLDVGNAYWGILGTPYLISFK